VAGAEVDAAPAAAEAGVDRDRGRRVGAVADAEGDRAVAGVGGDLGGRGFDDALFGFGHFPFFFGGDFGAELDVFFVFDRAVVGVHFFVFVRTRFVAVFGFFVRRGQRRGRQGQAHCLRRDGGSTENEQGQKQGDKQFSHRPTIGVSAILL